MAQQRWRAVTIAIALGAASPAAADALQYQAPEVPDGCPDELAFRQALRRELPASATDDRGGARFVATVETDGAAWTATLVVETDGRGAIVARLVDTTCEAAVTRLATLAPGGRVRVEDVERELTRLRRSQRRKPSLYKWQKPHRNPWHRHLHFPKVTAKSFLPMISRPCLPKCRELKRPTEILFLRKLRLRRNSRRSQ